MLSHFCLMEFYPLFTDKSPQMQAFSNHATRNASMHFSPFNITNNKLVWEGGSFPYEETRHDDHDNVFYNRAVIVAPIVGSIFIIFLVVIGVYSLRQYDAPELTRAKDAESPCESCTHSRADGIRYKIQNYVMRIFDVKQDAAYIIRMNPGTRTLARGEIVDARETLV